MPKNVTAVVTPEPTEQVVNPEPTEDTPTLIKEFETNQKTVNREIEKMDLKSFGIYNLRGNKL